MDSAELRRLVAQSAGPHGLSEIAAERVVRKSDGVALFAEQLTIDEVAREAASRTGEQPYRSKRDDVAPVPATLVDGLMARLDGIEGGKQVACAAAVINREFSVAFLAEVLDVQVSEVNQVLVRLERAEVLTRFRDGFTDRYRFKHALSRDGAYDSLLKGDRCDQHRRIAELLEKFYPELNDNQPELLAYHHYEARNREKAVQLWLAAGRQALSRSANAESIAHFRSALALIGEGAQTDERLTLELNAQLDLGLSLIAVDGYPSQDTRECFASALRLSERLERHESRSRALFGLWGHHWMSGRDDEAMRWAKLIAEQAQAHGDRAVEIIGHRAMGCSHFTRGEFERAEHHLDRTIELARSLDSDGLGHKYLVEPEFVATLMAAWADWFLGRVDRAVARAHKALDMAIHDEHAYSIAFSSYVCSAIYLQRSEFDKALAHAERSFELSSEHRFSLYELYARFSRGCALVGLGDAVGGFDEIDQGIASADQAKVGYMRPMMLGWKADLQNRFGARDIAASTLDAAFEFVRMPCGQSWLPELLRLRALFELRSGGFEPAVVAGDLNDAITLARQQGARSWELRATALLAENHDVLGVGEQAIEMLTSVLARFDEGADTHDVAGARRIVEG